MSTPRALLLFDDTGRLCAWSAGALDWLPGLAAGAPFPAGDPALPGRTALPDGRVLRWEPLAIAGSVGPHALLLSPDAEPPARAARAETLGEALATLVHRINNRLTVVLGSLDAVDAALPAGHQARAPLARAREAARHSADTFRAAARFRHGPAGEPPADLGESLLRVAPLLGGPVPDGVPARVALSPSDLDAALLRAGLDAGTGPDTVALDGPSVLIGFGAHPLRLPLAPSAPPAPLAPPGAPVLIVEPDDDLREMFLAALRPLGRPLRAAAGPAQAEAVLGSDIAAIGVFGHPGAASLLGARCAHVIELRDAPAAPTWSRAAVLVRPFPLSALLAACRAAGPGGTG